MVSLSVKVCRAVCMCVWQWGVVAGWHVYIWHPRHVRWKSLTGSQWWQSPRSVACTSFYYCFTSVSHRCLFLWILPQNLWLGRLLRVKLMTLEVEMYVCLSVRTSIYPSVRRSTKSLSDINEISYVHTDRWVMHDGMPYDPTQGQGQGHGICEVPKIALFSSAIYNGSWQMTTNS